MRAWVLAGLIAGSPGVADAAPGPQRADVRTLIAPGKRVMVGATRLPVFVRIPQSAQSTRPTAVAPLRASSRENFRVAPSADESEAGNRAQWEVEKTMSRRPRAFSFRPVMSLTFDTSDLDGPAHLGGVAPRLLGVPKPR